MTTSTLDRIPLDQITARAREVRPGRTVLTLIAGALFGLGWITAKVFSVAWLCLAWSLAAVQTGYEAAHGPTRGQQIAMLTAEVAGLRDQVKRLGG